MNEHIFVSIAEKSRKMIGIIKDKYVEELTSYFCDAYSITIAIWKTEHKELVEDVDSDVENVDSVDIEIFAPSKESLYVSPLVYF